MTETYLWAALALMHTLGAYMTLAMWEAHQYRTWKRRQPILDAVICFLIWELVALWVIFEKTEPKPKRK